MDKICGNCKFWAEPADRQHERGDCRRRSPVVVQIANLMGQGGAQYGQTVWPLTGEKDWCGEWERKVP